ncbi:MAG: aminopeptidase [Actinobacteria bacterium]|nr:aminopeptidase [Actinomycetota bacterium]
MDGSIELAAIAHRVVASYLGIKPGETFLIVADTRTAPSIPRALAGQALALGADPVISVSPPRSRSGEEPPGPVAAAMLEADVVLACASTSMYHTEAKGAAQRKGVRGAFNAPSAEDAWTRGAMRADFEEIRRQAERLRDRWATARTVRVTSPAGTDLTMVTEGRQPRGWLTGICRNPGEVSAYPGGEVSLPPVEGTAEGVVVVERVLTDIGALSEPITWIVRDGEVVDIRGGGEARALEAHVEGVAGARNIGEIGIGLNPSARITPDITESKKRLGTAHVAMGDSAGEYGGNVVSDVHLDGLILDAVIEFDGEVVVDRGRVLP